MSRLPSIPVILALMAPVGLYASDALTVGDGGTLIVRSGGAVTVNGADILVEDGATMEIEASSVTTADTLRVALGGVLTGCGTINAVLINEGLIMVDCTSPSGLVLQQSVTNYGDFIVANGASLTVGAHLFENHCFLDLRGAASQVLPTNFQNFGHVALHSSDSSAVITLFAVSGVDFTVQAKTSVAYSYHLEHSTDLVNWTDVSTPEAGGGTMVFTHVGGAPTSASTRSFYRVAESP